MKPSARQTDVIVEAYLKQVGQALTGVSKAYRAELVADLRAHVEAEREAMPDDSEARVREILDRLGPPDAVAAAVPKDGEDASIWSPRARRIAWLTVIALIAALVVLGLIVYLFFTNSASVQDVKQAPLGAPVPVHPPFRVA